MDNTARDIERLEEEFKACQKILSAIGNETRQHLVCIMLEGPCDGARAVDIAARTNLSRPAVSHHMQILKDAGIVKSRKEGTFVYYYLEPSEEALGRLSLLIHDIRRITGRAPERADEYAVAEAREERDCT